MNIQNVNIVESDNVPKIVEINLRYMNTNSLEKNLFSYR